MTKFLKALSIFIILIVATKDVKAQFVTIPDANFVTWLNNNGFSSCMNGNQLNTSCSAVQNAIQINCSNAGILNLTGIESFDNLINLDCSHNPDIYIPSLPNSLFSFTCTHSNLNTLPQLPSNLRGLNIVFNNVAFLPNNMPNTLTDIAISYNDFNSWLFLPPNLVTLWCENNQITAFPSLPNTLEFLECSNNQLSSLPALPDSLEYLSCRSNLLTVLPFLTAKLVYLDCSYNYVLGTLPYLPNTVKHLKCINCGLTNFFNLPDTMNTLWIDNNPNLKCLPSIKKIVSDFRWGNTGITCLANSITVGSAIPSIQNLSLCNWNNINNCSVGVTIKGSIYSDNNSNCNLDTLEVKFPLVKMNLSTNGTLVQQIYTNQFGEYSFETNAGTFEIAPDTTSGIFHVNCPAIPNYIVMIDSLNPLENNKDFSISCKVGFDLSVTTAYRDSGLFRPGAIARIRIVAGGNNLTQSLSCVSGIAGTLKVVIQGPATYISPSLNALIPTVVGDTLIYTIPDFGLINPTTAFGFNVYVDTTAMQNQSICVEVFVDSILGDIDFSNNYLSHCFNIVNSYDPNDKAVFPDGITNASYDWFTYTIRFQNTGNAPAQLVYILDTLDQYLDESSFQLLAYSHEPEIQIEGKRTKFYFRNINLPDSVNDEPNSHGFIQYKIKRISNLGTGAQIRNTAYIYFDYNTPVKTNTTLNQLGVVSDFVLIPDSNFVLWLKSNGFSNCMYENLLDTTCNQVLTAVRMSCSNSSIKDLTGVQYFKSLDSLICSNNQLENLPLLPPLLSHLNFSSNFMDSLYNLPLSITSVDCSFNLIDSITSLSTTLKAINCESNFLSTLPSLPVSLTYFNCSQNQLQSLPPIPSSLTYLICNQNQLLSLPLLPNSLEYLSCHSNQLTSIPSIPNSLIYLACNGNQISVLPNFQNNLKNIFVQDNQLFSLNYLPDTMINLNVSNNPGLTCLQTFREISNEFNWVGTGINCLPNIFVVGLATPSLVNVPICNILNANNCQYYPNISGEVFADSNSNCQVDSSESKNGNVKVKLLKGGILEQQTYSNSAGEYSFGTDVMGLYVYEVDTLNLPYRVNCPSNGRYTSNISVQSVIFENQDFSLNCKTGFDVGSSIVKKDSGIFRSGDYAKISIIAGDLSQRFNLNCALGVAGSVRVIMKGPVSFVNSSTNALIPIVNGDTLFYTVSDFGNIDINSAFNFLLQTDSIAFTGDQICFNVLVTPIGGDNFVDNNDYNHCFEVLDSIIPNTKEVSPIGVIDTSEHWLTYTIAYQNVSGTLVQDMRIDDIIDIKLDRRTFELVSFSHPVQIQLMLNQIHFIYHNINLPDSSVDFENSKGFVQYRVRKFDNLQIGSKILNTAFVFFDSNPPIQTNTTMNEIGLTSGVGVGENQNPILFSIFPNPLASQQMLNLYFNSSEKRKAELIVYDLSGRKLYAQFVNASEQTQTVSLPNISPGVYLVVVNDGKHQRQQKLVVLKNSN